MKRVLFSFAALAALLAITGTAHADLQIIATEGGNSATFTGTGSTAAAPVLPTNVSGTATGAGTYTAIPGNETLSVQFSHIGDFTLAVNMAQGNVPGVSGLADLNGSFRLTNTSGSTQTITLDLGGNPYLASLFSTSTVAVNESVTGADFIKGSGSLMLSSYIQSGTGTFGSTADLNPAATGTQYGPTETITSNTGADNTVYEPKSILGSGNFAIGEKLVITLSAGGVLSFNSDTNVSPEPATLAAWGCGLGLIGLVRRRRRAAQTA